MTNAQIIESLKEVIASLKSQIEVYRLEREQDKRQINALLSIINTSLIFAPSFKQRPPIEPASLLR